MAKTALVRIQHEDLYAALRRATELIAGVADNQGFLDLLYRFLKTSEIDYTQRCCRGTYRCSMLPLYGWLAIRYLHSVDRWAVTVCCAAHAAAEGEGPLSVYRQQFSQLIDFRAPDGTGSRHELDVLVDLDKSLSSVPADPAPLNSNNL